MNSTKQIVSFTRESWTLGDLRDLVDEVAEWDDDAEILLTAPSDRVARGTVEVVVEG